MAKAECQDEGNDKVYFCNGQDRVKYIQITLLVLNIIFIVAIFVVAVMWNDARSKPLTDMMPTPNKDRSICAAFNEDKSCRRTELPEKYLSGLINKTMRRLQMQYMAEKLNYANVVCRKSSPSIYLFGGVDIKFSSGDYILWKNNMAKVQPDKRDHSVTYGYESGKFKVNKNGMYFINSQIMENALNLRSNGTSFQITLNREGQPMTLLESESAPCLLVNAKGQKAHYVGSAYRLLKDDLVYASHSNPGLIVDSQDSFMGIRELW